MKKKISVKIRIERIRDIIKQYNESDLKISSAKILKEYNELYLDDTINYQNTIYYMNKIKKESIGTNVKNTNVRKTPNINKRKIVNELIKKIIKKYKDNKKENIINELKDLNEKLENLSNRNTPYKNENESILLEKDNQSKDEKQFNIDDINYELIDNYLNDNNKHKDELFNEEDDNSYNFKEDKDKLIEFTLAFNLIFLSIFYIVLSTYLIFQTQNIVEEPITTKSSFVYGPGDLSRHTPD